MKIYGYPSTRSTRVLWAAEEVGIEYEFIPIDLGKGAGRQPDYLQINPGGKVPALVDDGIILTESAAICTYLGERFPESGLVPAAGTIERARYLQWCFFVIGELEQPLWTLAKHTFALPPAQRVPEVKATARWEFERAADVLAAGLGDREFILGARFSAADILIAHTLGWAKSADASFPQPNLGTYLERVSSRAALTRARQREAAAA